MGRHTSDQYPSTCNTSRQEYSLYSPSDIREGHIPRKHRGYLTSCGSGSTCQDFILLIRLIAGLICVGLVSFDYVHLIVKHLSSSNPTTWIRLRLLYVDLPVLIAALVCLLSTIPCARTFLPAGVLFGVGATLAGMGSGFFLIKYWNILSDQLPFSNATNTDGAVSFVLGTNAAGAILFGDVNQDGGNKDELGLSHSETNLLTKALRPATPYLVEPVKTIARVFTSQAFPDHRDVLLFGGAAAVLFTATCTAVCRRRCQHRSCCGILGVIALSLSGIWSIGLCVAASAFVNGPIIVSPSEDANASELASTSVIWGHVLAAPPTEPEAKLVTVVSLLLGAIAAWLPLLKRPSFGSSSCFRTTFLLAIAICHAAFVLLSLVDLDIGEKWKFYGHGSVCLIFSATAAALLLTTLLHTLVVKPRSVPEPPLTLYVAGSSGSARGRSHRSATSPGGRSRVRNHKDSREGHQKKSHYAFRTPDNNEGPRYSRNDRGSSDNWTSERCRNTVTATTGSDIGNATLVTPSVMGPVSAGPARTVLVPISSVEPYFVTTTGAFDPRIQICNTNQPPASWGAYIPTAQHSAWFQ